MRVSDVPHWGLEYRVICTGCPPGGNWFTTKEKAALEWNKRKAATIGDITRKTDTAS